jgi:polar amino acid transport system substrate-binding protein
MKFVATLFLITLTAVAAHARSPVKWVFTDYPPANFKTEDGKYSGFLHDILTVALDRHLGVPVHIAVYPWKRCQAMVREGTADLMVTIPTAERMTYCVTHKTPIWIKKYRLYTYRGHPRMTTMDRVDSLEAIQAEGYTVISYLGNGWIENHVESIGIKVLYAATVESMYRMLAAQRGDVIIEEKRLATPLITTQRLAEQIVETRGIASQSGFHILIGKRSPLADQVDRLERVIVKMHDRGDIQRIIERYDDTFVP